MAPSRVTRPRLEDSLKLCALQAKVRALEARLEACERLAAIGQVAAGIAHELINPALYLLENVATLRAGLAAHEEQARRPRELQPADGADEPPGELAGLLGDLEEGAQLVHQLALRVRTQARVGDKPGHSDLSEAARFAARIARTQVQQRAELKIHGVPIRVRGGQVQLTQVVLNLIVNAAQAMEGLGRRGKIEVGWEAAAEQGVRAWVKDDGPGIPTALHQKVFEPLFTTRAAGGGTGLGLTICRELVAGMGGRLALSSKPGEGTTVELWLQQPREASSARS